MTKIKTTKGIINNNTIKHKITKDTATIFNFCIDSVTLDDDTLTVACTTLLGDTVEYNLDISSDTKALPSVLENLNVAGDVNLFLALAYRIYEAGLEPSEDIPSADCTELQARIAELEAQLPLSTDHVWGVTHLAGAYVQVIEDDINSWQEQEDKSTLNINENLTVNLPFTIYEGEGVASHFGEEAYYTTMVKINNQETSFNMYYLYTPEPGTGKPPRLQGELVLAEPLVIPVAEDHLLEVEVTITNYNNEQVTIQDTLNLDTKEWTGGGDFTNISRTPTEIQLTVDDEYDLDSPMGISGILSNTENDMVDAPVTIQVTFSDDTTYTMHDYTNSNGVFDTSILLNELKEGTCTIQAIYKGDQQYKPTTTTETTTINGGG